MDDHIIVLRTTSVLTEELAFLHKQGDAKAVEALIGLLAHGSNDTFVRLFRAFHEQSRIHSIEQLAAKINHG